MSGPFGSSQWMYSTGGFYPYEIEQSLRFNDDDSAYLSRTPASAGNRKTWTWSGWVKLGAVDTSRNLFSYSNGGATDQHWLWLLTDGSLDLRMLTSSVAVGTKRTTALFRDPSAWYHIVAVWDTSNATAADRIRLYVNGERITSFQTSTDPPLNTDGYINDTLLTTLSSTIGVQFFDGYMAEVNFIDGSALDPTSFGQFKSGIWVPKAYTGSYGTNGFYLPFSDSAAIGDDLSGNTNDWTPSGLASTDVMLDSPTNNYCVLNPVDPRTTGTLSDGNLVTTGNAAVTIRPTTGKWYYEKDGVGVDYDADVSGPFDPVLTSGTYNFGQSPFSGTPTAGHKLINTANLPAPAIDPAVDDVPADYFNTVLYTGNGSTLAVTGVGFQPDWTWIKGRSGATDHALYDAVRGVQEQLESNQTGVETTEATGLTAFGADGFSVGALAQLNTSTATYVAWNWLAGNGTSSNTDGSITSTVSANQKARFSIVSYTGTGANATVGHGLNAVPKLIIVKNRDQADAWQVYHGANTANPETDYLVLNTTAATVDAADRWNDTLPTTAVFSIGTGVTVNTNTENYIAYCFAEVEGFSKFGSYTGNGSADGPMVWTGHRPAFIMVKRTDTTGNWTILDDAREGYNVDNDPLYPNLSNAEGTTDLADLLSNGFKLRSTDASVNASGGTYIFAAFAQQPVKFSNAR